jgi:hypothetical protein
MKLRNVCSSLALQIVDSVMEEGGAGIQISEVIFAFDDSVDVAVGSHAGGGYRRFLATQTPRLIGAG